MFVKSTIHVIAIILLALTALGFFLKLVKMNLVWIITSRPYRKDMWLVLEVQDQKTVDILNEYAMKFDCGDMHVEVGLRQYIWYRNCILTWRVKRALARAGIESHWHYCLGADELGLNEPDADEPTIIESSGTDRTK